MSDLKLTTLGDLDVINGELTLLQDEDSIAQDLVIRLRTFLGEWFLDQKIGIPYFESILIKNADIRVVESIFREVILSADGVDTIESLDFDFEGTTRQLQITAEIKLLEGGTFEFVFNELILGV